MATEVGTAYVSIIPSTQGFRRNLQKDVQPDARQAGKATGAVMGGALGAAAGGSLAKAGLIGAAAAALALPFGGAISKASEFDKTIRTVGTAAGISGAGLADLSSLALKMGADTTFSAQGAADAMLALSKGGLTAAQIKAGALKDTLLLASAGGLELGSAADFMVQGLTTFGLSADQGGQVASALAGAANASTASVESIGQALSQVGPGAVNAGLSIQETTAALAAFDNAGIKGSDAGTSLKTMLTRLVPSTDKARGAMADLGLDFTDAAGNILSIADVAGQLQGAFRGLSEEAKTTALNEIFGSDAARAASVLATNGAEGINKMIAATSDQGAAARLAAVGTAGYAGALEQFKGSVETAQIVLGQKLLPIATKVLNSLTRMVNAAAPLGARLSAAFQPVVGIFQRVFGAFRTEGVAAGFAQLGAIIAAVTPVIGARLAELGGRFLAWITPLIPPLLLKLGQFAGAIFTWISTVAAPRLATGLGLLAENLTAWILPRIPFLLKDLGIFLAKGLAWIVTDGIPMMIAATWNLGVAIVTGIGRGFAQAFPTFMANLLRTLPDWFKKLVGIDGATITMPKLAVPSQQQAATARGVATTGNRELTGPRPAPGASTVYQLNGPVVASDPVRLQRELEQRRRLQALAVGGGI